MTILINVCYQNIESIFGKKILLDFLNFFPAKLSLFSNDYVMPFFKIMTMKMIMLTSSCVMGPFSLKIERFCVNFHGFSKNILSKVFLFERFLVPIRLK